MLSSHTFGSISFQTRFLVINSIELWIIGHDILRIDDMLTPRTFSISRFNFYSIDLLINTIRNSRTICDATRTPFKILAAALWDDVFKDVKQYYCTTKVAPQNTNPGWLFMYICAQVCRWTISDFYFQNQISLYVVVIKNRPLNLVQFVTFCRKHHFIFLNRLKDFLMNHHVMWHITKKISVSSTTLVFFFYLLKTSFS